MNFVSIPFLLIFPLVLMLYWRLSQKQKTRLLLAVSYGFYIYWNHWVALVFLATSLFSYRAGIKIAKAKKDKESKKWLFTAVFINLFALFMFKYLGFFTFNMTSLLQISGMMHHVFIWKILLPVGISFHTFQTLSYVFDVYKKKVKAEEDVMIFMLYVSYFPQLVAGPIERADALIPQLKKKQTFQWENIEIGFMYMLKGYLKKILLADYLAPFVNKVYQNPKDMNGPEIALATLLFAFQIYGDFSGYSDIAIGCARMMGIELTQNFKAPYGAKNMRDFWKRWHITLSSWFLDYVYIPLGGSKKGKRIHIRNMMIVFLLSGFWHGAKWHFVVWGLLHGIAVIAEVQVIEPICKRIKEQKYTTWIRSVLTFLWINLAWIYFRAPSLYKANLMFKKVMTEWSFEKISSMWQTIGLGMESILRIVFSILCILLIEKMPHYLSLQEAQNGEDFEKQSWLKAYVVFLLVLILGGSILIQVKSQMESSFLYFQF